MIVPPTPSASDPVTTAMTGTHTTYDVGPGKPYTPDTMPWDKLQGGDVVNIYYQATPYLFKFCLAATATQSAPVVVNGVTDASGHRPVFNFSGAKTASACKNVFNTASAYSLEPFGGIVVGPVLNNVTHKASFITIKNLELHGAANGNTFTTLANGSGSYSDSGAIWIQLGSDITVENNIISDNAFGVFVMTKDSSTAEMCERITLRNNRIFGNGAVGSYLDHNVYMQSTNPIVEGNFFGQLRMGALGSSYKSRSSGETFRYNYVQASARAVDWVQSEDSNPGITTQPDYGTDYAYGNVFVNDQNLPLGAATNPIHYGGDNCGEQSITVGSISATTAATSVASTIASTCHGEIYRQHLYFYNNTVINNTSAYASVVELSLDSGQVDAWNNIFYFSGGGQFALLDSVGKMNLRGTNLIFGTHGYTLDKTHLAVTSPGSATGMGLITVMGTVLSSSPAFLNVATGDFDIGSTSGAIDMAGGTPTGTQAVVALSGTLIGAAMPFAPSIAYMQDPVSAEPRVDSNGAAARTITGAAMDLGAMEAQ